MKNFAAIDFETANGNRSSICSMGLVVVKEGAITDTFYRLVHPVPDYYSYWNTQIHGLTAQDTRGAADFPEVWAEAVPLIGNLPLVAQYCGYDLTRHHHALADAEACAHIALMLLDD